jgi:hypothetical protein
MPFIMPFTLIYGHFNLGLATTPILYKTYNTTEGLVFKKNVFSTLKKTAFYNSTA